MTLEEYEKQEEEERKKITIEKAIQALKEEIWYYREDSKEAEQHHLADCWEIILEELNRRILPEKIKDMIESLTKAREVASEARKQDEVEKYDFCIKRLEEL